MRISNHNVQLNNGLCFVNFYPIYFEHRICKTKKVTRNSWYSKSITILTRPYASGRTSLYLASSKNDAGWKRNMHRLCSFNSKARQCWNNRDTKTVCLGERCCL